MGVTATNVAFGVAFRVGAGLRIEVSRGQTTVCKHDPHDLGDATDSDDWNLYRSVCAATKTSKAAFVAAFAAAWPDAATAVSAWPAEERDGVYEIAVFMVGALGL